MACWSLILKGLASPAKEYGLSPQGPGEILSHSCFRKLSLVGCQRKDHCIPSFLKSILLGIIKPISSSMACIRDKKIKHLPHGTLVQWAGQRGKQFQSNVKTALLVSGIKEEGDLIYNMLKHQHQKSIMKYVVILKILEEENKTYTILLDVILH